MWEEMDIESRVCGEAGCGGTEMRGKGMIVYLLLFYLLATFMAISGWVLTCDSVHTWCVYSAAPPGNQAFHNMIGYPTQSHHPDTEPTSPCSVLIMPNTWLGSDMYQFDKSSV